MSSCLVLGASCSLPRAPVAYQELDQRPPAPAGKRESQWVRPDDLDQGRAPKADGEDCGARSGRAANGKCERLRAEAIGFGERVLLPRGSVLVGNVPGYYKGGVDSTGALRLRYKDQPIRSESLDSFWIDVVEVQRADYAACVKAKRCLPARCEGGSEGIGELFAKEDQTIIDALPQTCVSFKQAQAYCAYRGGQLPTHAQWTYAARGPEFRVYSWGSQLNDSISMSPLPSRLHRDSSYFGIRGLSSSASEILRDRPVLDQALMRWLKGPFRQRNGPYLKQFDRWITRMACPKGRLTAACRAKEKAHRHLITGPRIEDAKWAWTMPPADPTLKAGPDGYSGFRIPDKNLGFRCVYPRRKQDPDLSVPKEPVTAPENLVGDSLSLFVGTAESVNFAEAQAFCAQVSLLGDKDRPDALPWRLPTANEVLLVEKLRLGPGPLWLKDGSATVAKLKKNGMVESWEPFAADQQNSGILARCVR